MIHKELFLNGSYLNTDYKRKWCIVLYNFCLLGGRNSNNGE